MEGTYEKIVRMDGLGSLSCAHQIYDFAHLGSNSQTSKHFVVECPPSRGLHSLFDALDTKMPGAQLSAH